MAKNLKIIAICGWAIPEKWFANLVENTFPDADVLVHYPQNPIDREEAKHILCNDTCDLYIGYSLGSLWLLTHKEYLSTGSIKVLLAPIIDLTKKECGSKLSLGQLKLLLKQIKNKPSPYVREFYQLCGINIPDSFINQIPEQNILGRGLEFLINNSVTKKSLDNFLGFIGSSDQILDSAKIKIFMPHLQITPNIGHEPKMLLDALSKANLFSSS